MFGKELKELIIALKLFIEAKTANLAVGTDIDKMRLKDWVRNDENYGFSLNDDDSPSWPDDFEEDWE